jgi:hypothetical protein
LVAGFFFRWATKVLRSSAGTTGATNRPFGICATLEIGAKLRRRSYSSRDPL